MEFGSLKLKMDFTIEEGDDTGKMMVIMLCAHFSIPQNMKSFFKYEIEFGSKMERERFFIFLIIKINK